MRAQGTSEKKKTNRMASELVVQIKKKLHGEKLHNQMHRPAHAGGNQRH